MKSTYTLALLFLFSCGPTQKKTPATDKEPSKETKIFDENSLQGWQNFGGGKFYVEDGAIVGEAAMGFPNSFLATEKMYGNFELELDFKIDSLLNSGIQIRSNVYEKETKTIRWGGTFTPDGSKDVQERTWEAGRFWGYQIEIDPSKPSWSGALYEEGGRGFLHTPGEDNSVAKAFKNGQWNHFRIVANGDHFQTWLNEVPVVDVKDNLTSTGYIALQLHGIGKREEKIGQKVRWKNFKLTEL